MSQNNNTHSYENSYDVREYYKRMKKGEKDLVISYEYYEFNPEKYSVYGNLHTENSTIEFDFLDIYNPEKLDSLIGNNKMFSMNAARYIRIIFDKKLITIRKSLRRADFLACWLAFKYNTKVTISSYNACTVDISYDKNSNCFEYNHNHYFI